MIFYKETDFKETPVGKIPKDWELKRLGDVCAKITDGTHKTPKYVDKGIPFLSTQNIVPFRKGFDFSEYEKYITREEHEELIKRCKPEKGDILVSKCGTIGRAKLIDVNYEFSIFVGLALLKLKKDLVIGEFLEQMLNYDPCRLRMEVSSPGSTRKTLTIHAIERLQIPFPSLEEQRAIVGVLGVVDSVIAKTGEVIAKTERLKKGLMQTLLTRGIGHKEYKQTPIGTIPKTWEVKRLEEASIEVTIGVVNPATPYYTSANDGVPYFRSQNVRENRLEPTNVYVKREFNERHPRSILKENDILTLQTGFIGVSCLVPKEYEGANCHSLLITRTNPKVLNPQFLCQFLNSAVGKKIIYRHNSGWGRAHLLLEDFRKIPIPIPPLQEQQTIAEILSTIDKKIEYEKKEKTRLERIKQGLMDLLLTGKIRVKVD